MSKRLILILALAFLVGLSYAAYAEVQNVKVSGDIQALGIARNNFDLTKEPASGSARTTDTYSDQREYLATIARLRVDADLTDNVSATIRLLNERNWNGDALADDAGNRNIGLGAPAAAYTDEQQIELDLAYMTLREFLYSPLTLSVGRQELHFGNDWIVGDPDTNGLSGRSNLSDGDLSSRKAFDALRATLDYSPLVVDIIYAKIAENTVALNDDTTLTGINAKYDLNKDTTLEGFFFSKVKGVNAAAVTNAQTGDATSFTDGTTIKQKTDKVHTVGARVVNKSIKNLTLDAQGAYQFGTYNPKFDVNARWTSAANRVETAPRNAWGAEVVATYNLKDIRRLSKYDPSVTAAYVVLSGQNRDRTGKKTYTGWDGMFENQTFGHIINGMMGFSNTHLTGLSLNAKPLDDLRVKLDAVGMWVFKRYIDNLDGGGATRLYNLSGVSGAKRFYMAKNPFMGKEFDLTLTYDYTEDVQFSLLGGVFLPGKAIATGDTVAAGGATGSDTGSKAAATELIGSMKVTF